MAAGHGRSVLIAVAESAYRFGLGAIAGCKANIDDKAYSVDLCFLKTKCWMNSYLKFRE